MLRKSRTTDLLKLFCKEVRRQGGDLGDEELSCGPKVSQARAIEANKE